MKSILKSQAGMSIIQVMIAAAMMGGLALVMGKMGENQSKMQRGAKESLDINALHNNIEKILLNSISCRETITQIANLPITPLADDSGVAINNIVSKVDDKVGTPTVTKFKIGRENNIGTIYIESIKATRFNQNEIRLRFVIKKLADGKRQSFGAKSLNKDISLIGKFTGNTPTGCFSQMDNAVISARAAACTDIGASWDSANYTCTLTDAFKKSLIEDALALLPTKDVFSVDGSLTMNAPSAYITKCQVSSKRCRRTSKTTCGRSCRAGFTVGNWSGGRYDERESPVNKKCMRRYQCRPNAKIGTLIP